MDADTSKPPSTHGPPLGHLPRCGSLNCLALTFSPQAEGLGHCRSHSSLGSGRPEILSLLTPMCQVPAMMLTSDVQLPGSWPKAGDVEGVRLNPCGPWANEVRVGGHPHSPQFGRAARRGRSQASGPLALPQGLQSDPYQLCYSLDHVISGKPCPFLVSVSLSVKWAH